MLSSTEEAQLRALLVKQTELLSLAASEPSIISELGAGDTTFPELTPATVINDADLLLVRQGTEEKSATGAVLKTTLGGLFAAKGANSDITSLSSPFLASATATTQTVGDNSTKVATTAFTKAEIDATVLRSYISGLSLSTAGSSTTMSIAAGKAADSANAAMMSLASAINKTTSSWAVGSGNGGIDTGAIASSTWYYFYQIRRPDTGVVDVIFSLSSASPTLPANYTQYRYIGGALTNGSSQWVKFTQFGDNFVWDSPVLDFNTTGATTSALLTCSLPSGRKMKGRFVFSGTSTGTAGIGTYISDPDTADLAPSQTASPLLSAWMNADPGSEGISVQMSCFTNNARQIRHREWNTGAIKILTLGWTDLRGKDL